MLLGYLMVIGGLGGVMVLNLDVFVVLRDKVTVVPSRA